MTWASKVTLCPAVELASTSGGVFQSRKSMIGAKAANTSAATAKLIRIAVVVCRNPSPLPITDPSNPFSNAFPPQVSRMRSGNLTAVKKDCVASRHSPSVNP